MKEESLFPILETDENLSSGKWNGRFAINDVYANYIQGAKSATRHSFALFWTPDPEKGHNKNQFPITRLCKVEKALLLQLSLSSLIRYFPIPRQLSRMRLYFNASKFKWPPDSASIVRMNSKDTKYTQTILISVNMFCCFFASIIAFI